MAEHNDYERNVLVDVCLERAMGGKMEMGLTCVVNTEHNRRQYNVGMGVNTMGVSVP